MNCWWSLVPIPIKPARRKDIGLLQWWRHLRQADLETARRMDVTLFAGVAEVTNAYSKGARL